MRNEIRVTWLRPKQIELARVHAIAVERYAATSSLKDTAGLRTTFADSVVTRQAAFEAEIAVALYAGLPWNRIVGLSNMPDVGEDVEVKNRARRYARYLVDTPDKVRPDRRYVITYGRHPELFLAGWIDGRRAQTFPVEALDPGRPTGAGYVVPASALRPMSTLEPLRSEILECPSCGDTFEVLGAIEPPPFRCIRCFDPRHRDGELVLGMSITADGTRRGIIGPG